MPVRTAHATKVGERTSRLTFTKMRWALTFLLIVVVGCNVKKMNCVEAVASDVSPLRQTMERDSMEEFQNKILLHPQWVNQKSKSLPDCNNMSVLVSAAITCRTNHVRLLIQNGADVEDAINWCKRNKTRPECTNLILTVYKQCSGGGGVE